LTTVAILTKRSLERVAAGATMNYAGSELFELSSAVGQVQVRAIYSREDGDDDRLIALMASTDKGLIPETLRSHQDAAYHRILNFAQRAETYPVTLPRGWHQFKHDNLMAFFALPEAIGRSERWIAEVNADQNGDVVFWELTSAQEKATLQEYIPDTPRYRDARESWRARRAEALAALGEQSAGTLGVDVSLDPALQAQSITKARTYSQWLPDLTPPQRDFVEAPADSSIRLRGPAGSGKTLTLCLKAVREVKYARARGNSLRVLFVTHSWSLAGEVDQLLTVMSEQGRLDEINVLPLVAVAQEILPIGMIPGDLDLIGDDSLTGKMTQLAEIEDIISEFRSGDWVTFRNRCSKNFRERLESSDETVIRGLAWDTLIEFGCVLGADGIFPSVNAEGRYLRVPRAPWMMRLDDNGDKRAVYAMYVMYYKSLQDRKLLTSDQLLNDFLNYLEGFTWNHRRLEDGYDLVFVDEFHLFNTLERHTLRYLSRDVTSYPRIFMAMDPRQSPWDVYFDGEFAEGTSRPGPADDDLDVKIVDIPTVHRSSPQILDLIKHIHLDWANLNLDEDWQYSISAVESLAHPGPKPALFLADTFGGEESAIYKALSETYSQSHSGARLALAILDEDAFQRYRPLIERIARSGKYRVIPITSRESTGVLQYNQRGIVVGPAEYLAGLQFDTVLVAGLPQISVNLPNQGVRRRGALSLLYLAISRASREVRLFSSDDYGGLPDVLARAKDEGVLGVFRV
jgi:hypothetical protein